MISQIQTVAFQGIEAVPVNVQVMAAPGRIGMSIVGLADKAVTESRERVQAALHASGLSIPPKRVTVNLAPADLPKEGSHYDLPIALCLMAVLGAIPSDSLQGFMALGELSLDGALNRVHGTLPAAITANALGKGIICPEDNGEETAWADGEMDILAPRSLISLANHFHGTQVLSRPVAKMTRTAGMLPDLNEIKGQETAKRALEIAAAGGHNMLMTGPPGSGKSMLASRLPGILPPLTTKELLEVSMIASISGELSDGNLSNRRPFRSPHHSASMAAMVGGGRTARPGEISMAHNGILFLDELPEFSPKTLNSLRQPLESGETSIARANYRINYPSRFQLVAAMNPCQCGMAGEPGYKCRRGERCASDYQGRISGPFLDRIDICVEVSAMSATDIIAPVLSESSVKVAHRVLKARRIQQERYADSPIVQKNNATADTKIIEKIVKLDSDGEKLMLDATGSMKLSARAYYRVLKVARTIADLEGERLVKRIHLAEAISYRVFLQRQGNAVKFNI